MTAHHHMTGGEHAEVELLFRRHSAALYRYLVQLTGSEDVAADAVQETFLRLLRTQPEDRAPRAWLFHVSTNLVREWARTASRRDTLLRAAPSDAATGEPPEDADRDLLARERHEIVLRALEPLQERDRIALLMRQAGFSHAEIGRELGVATTSVGQIVARALLKVSRTLSDSRGSL